MKAREDIPVSACRVAGSENRYFGKFRDPEERNPRKRWKKIPGGSYAPEIDTKEKALRCARRWYEVEVASRRVDAASGSAGSAKSWPEICDLFLAEVKMRIRGADASRDEAEKRAQFLRRSPVLGSRPVGEHDDALGLVWLRQMLSEPLNRKGHEDEPRDPLTVRNAAKILRDIYKFARSKGHFPRDRTLPTESDEFRAEIAGALKEKAKLQKEGRVACPTETVRAIVGCKEIPEARRLMRRTAFFTGMAPGELHGLHVGDYRSESGVKILDVQLQWTLERKGYPARLAPLKTVWRRRKLPVHTSLELWLDDWIAAGWKRHVGREPSVDDFLFPDSGGNAFREESCDTFLGDVRRAKCDTVHKGITLDIYSLRHSFATIIRRAGVPSDARDRLLGHRPKDTKALHYEDEDLPVLAAEVAKIPSLLDDGERAAGPTSPPGRGGGVGGNRQDLVLDLVTENLHATDASPDSSIISAEKVRFELTEPLRARRFSKPLP